jgi:excinuclease UvrABC nuclease subunit
VTKHIVLPSPVTAPNAARPERRQSWIVCRAFGPARSKALVARFGGLPGVLAATADQLAEVTGISREMADKIYSALH